MKIIEPGHVYELDNLDPIVLLDRTQTLTFVNREDKPHPGTQTQEVLRALIDRTKHCDNCLRWEGNDKIIYHLRMALALHEARHLERGVEKGELFPEHVLLDKHGHFSITGHPLDELSAFNPVKK